MREARCPRMQRQSSIVTKSPLKSEARAKALMMSHVLGAKNDSALWLGARPQSTACTRAVTAGDAFTRSGSARWLV